MDNLLKIPSSKNVIIESRQTRAGLLRSRQVLIGDGACREDQDASSAATFMNDASS